MEVVYLVVLGLAVAAFVSRPFWGGRSASPAEDPRIAGLEAAREAKYREIRDAEIDFASGKLSREDFDQVNAELRNDAVTILKELDDAKAASSAEAEGSAGPGDDPPKTGAS
jgi:hypothetical protein